MDSDNDGELLTTLPRIPAPTVGQNPWSPHVVSADNILHDIYAHAYSVLGQEADPNRLQIHIDYIANDALPIIEGLEAVQIAESIPINWIHTITTVFAVLVVDLRGAANKAQEQEDAHVAFATPVTREKTGKKGRPRVTIDPAALHEAFHPSRKISLTRLGKALGVHRNTLRKHLVANNIDYKFTTIDEADLDEIVKAYKTQKPGSGFCYLIGFLRRTGIRLQKEKVRLSLARHDRLGRVLRGRKTIKRRRYTSTRPNALWHCDGHHKLIQWGIVIHGFVDGYCRTVVAMHASSNNRADTVLEVFLRAIKRYGTPSRIRGDRGGENTEISVWIILRRGPNRASFMWGSSTHNTRIERMWVEVGREFARSWRGFFHRLERLHSLDREDPHHLWLLHFLFLDLINEDCTRFQKDWNAHPISGQEGNDESPNDKRFLGQLEDGMYLDDDVDNQPGVHPDILHYYYGTTHAGVRRHRTGAGNPPEEEDSDNDSDEDLEDRIAADQLHHVRHEAIPVPDHFSPFPKHDHVFLRALAESDASNALPSGYGLLEDEWEEGEYPSQELIKVGRRRTHLIVLLPDGVWRPRAERWGRALDLMTRMVLLIENDNN